MTPKVKPPLKTLKDCRRCPRLVAHLQDVAKQYPDYHSAPVGQWGPKGARVLVVGLAPGLHGANRTGRAFVGDASGKFLFAALAATGFASSQNPHKARLSNMAITNVVKCLPPNNQVIAAERHNCQPFLQDELVALWTPKARRQRVVLALGGVAWGACRQALASIGIPANNNQAQAGSGLVGLSKQDTRFAHGQQVQLAPNLTLMASYHPSRQNVNTGRLNQAMLQQVLSKVRGIIMAV